MSNYIIYCRKSTESEERQVLSIESQIKELSDLAQRRGLHVTATLTESRSAKLPGRPVFGSLMEKISRSELKGIISWKLDRLARNPIDGAALVWALDQGKLSEIITPTNCLSNNSNDKFLMQLEFGMAKKYVDDLSDNVRRGLRMKLEKGWLPGRPPIGYLNEPSARTIVCDPERFAIVRKMWDSLLQGNSAIRIQRIAADDWGLRTVTHKKSGGCPLSLSGVYRTFTNPFYYGVIETKAGVFQGSHEPMITQDEFWKAQAILGRKGKPRPKTRRFAFTGLIRCGECGGAITAEEKINRYGSHYAYYHCTKKNRAVSCSQKAISAADLNNQIIQFLTNIYIPKDLLDIALSYLKDESKDQNRLELELKSSHDKALKECDRKLEVLNQMRLRELIDDGEYLREKRTLVDEKLRLQQQGESNREIRKRTEELTFKTFHFAHEAKKRFIKGFPEEQREILQEIGSNFRLKDKKLTLDVEKPFVLLEKSIEGQLSGNGRIELQKNETNTTLNSPSSSLFPIGCTLVHDVRTFYQEKLRKEINSAKAA